MTHFLIVLGILAAYALLILVFPVKPCRACGRYRGKPCPRCGGTGRRFRLGARLVHGGAVKAIKRYQERKRS